MTRNLVAIIAALGVSASLAAIACPGDKSCDGKACAKGSKAKSHGKHHSKKAAETTKTSEKEAAPAAETKVEGK